MSGRPPFGYCHGEALSLLELAGSLFTTLIAGVLDILPLLMPEEDPAYSLNLAKRVLALRPLRLKFGSGATFSFFLPVVGSSASNSQSEDCSSVHALGLDRFTDLLWRLVTLCARVSLFSLSSSSSENWA